MKTNEELEKFAEIIANLVKTTDTDQRHILYEKVANNLKANSQGWSARLFEYISYKDRNG